MYGGLVPKLRARPKAVHALALANIDQEAINLLAKDSMKPKSFDLDTAKEIVGDERKRTIEAKARADADAGKYEPPPETTGSYWSQISGNMDWMVYTMTHGKRLERIERMKGVAA